VLALVIVGDFDTCCVSVFPDEAEPVSISDPDRTLAEPIGLQALKPVVCLSG
jgi:hypothetical protein